MSNKQLKKSDLIDILVDEYGYDKEDLKDEDGKILTNARLNQLINQEKEDAESVELESTIVRAKVEKIKEDDEIQVMNGLSGELIHRSESTGKIWKLRDFGQVEKIPYGELLRIRNMKPKVFDDGWLIILNPQVQEDFRLTEKYKNILTPDNIEAVFKKNAKDLEVFVKSLPKAMRSAFMAHAKKLYRSNKIDSVRVVNFIEEEFGISLEDNAPISDIVLESKDK